MEFTPSSAVPFKVIAQLGSDDTVAFPAAVHVMVEPLSVPSAVPASFKSPAQVALNEPFAAVGVSSVAFHLKSEHDVAAGITPAEVDVQLPIRDAMDVPLGLVTVVLFSYPTQALARAAQERIKANAYFFMVVKPCKGRPWVAGEEIIARS